MEKMIAKIFGEKEIRIRSFLESDLQRVKEFQEFINSLVEEDAKILLGKKASLDNEKDFLTGTLKRMKLKKQIFLVAEHNENIIGTVSIKLEIERQEHIGSLGIAIKNGYRGIGLGKYLMNEIIELAQKELDPKPKIIGLEVYSNNKPAIALYKSLGFKKVAEIPHQVSYREELISLIVMLLYLNKVK